MSARFHTSAAHIPQQPMSLSRRGVIGLFGGLAVAGPLSACTNDANEPAVASPSGSSSGGPFPVSVPTVFGDVQVPAEPKRIVTVGVTEQDALWALGLAPVGVTEWYGGYPSAAWPWAEQAASAAGAAPEVLTTSDGFDFESIAALRPDLIIGINAGTTKKDWNTLSAIAPTVAQPGKQAWFGPWQVEAGNVGLAVGKPDEVAQLIAGVTDKYQQAAEAHPEFAGKKAVFLQNAFYDGAAVAYPEGLSTEFLTSFGFTIPEVLKEYAGSGDSPQAFIPKEDLVDALDEADVLVWATEADEDVTKLEKDPIFQQLRATKEGRNVYTGGVLSGAIYFTSLLSLPYVVDELTPMLAAALKV